MVDFTPNHLRQPGHRQRLGPVLRHGVAAKHAANYFLPVAGLPVAVNTKLS